jgi:2-polyprenyl-3-methyl-5-hydroxy-6-metoxy-1,4-benzoquinol methylase
VSDGNARFERVVCPLCGVEDEELRLEKDEFRIVRCRRCALVYVNPRLTMAALAAMYNEQEISPAPYYVRTERQDERSFDARLQLIERYRHPGTLLDLGCGPGTFSKVARARGWRTKGIDVNAAMVERCRSLGLDVECGVFPHPALADQRFDVVVMSDFLEHVADPAGVLAAAREALVPDGFAFITTPDIGAVVARLTGKRWLHLKPNEHIVYFDRRTIGALLERTGFRVEHLRSIGRVRNLGVALEKVAAYGELPAKLGRALVPGWIAERVNLPFNPGDEMAIIARRTR